MTSLQHLTSIISLLKTTGNPRIFDKYKRFWGLKRQKIVRMHKTCLTSQFLRHSLARFSRKMACLPTQKNLANKSLRNCDVRQVLCIRTIFCRFAYSSPSYAHFGTHGNFGLYWQTSLKTFLL